MAQELSLLVTGMSCTGCEDNITRALRRLDGVRESAADFRGGRVRVLFDPRRTSAADIRVRIETAGYDVTESGSETP